MTIYDRVFMRSALASLTLVLLGPAALRAQDGPMKVSFYHLDAQGNVLCLTDWDGNEIESHDYDVFGQEVGPQPGTQPLRFTGKERDAETGWDYFGARYYSSHVGRFTTTDPVLDSKAALVDPQRWNRYAYGRNNPLRWVDPDGKDVVLAVRNNSGGGWTNFGHTALRVVGEGYDRTYDFGRYGATWGLMKSEGEGVLRVWSDWDAFVATQRPKGDLRTVRYKTSKETDEAIMGDFAAQAAAGERRPGGKSYEEFRLSEDYDLRSNNCTTG